MAFKVCLSKKLIIFYSLIGLPIIYGSIVNLNNIISGTGSVLVFGGFSLFGFILLPVLLISSYRNNLCKVEANGISLGKNYYQNTDYTFKISSYELPLGDRPLVSLYKKTYYRLIIKKKNSKQISIEKDLDIFKNEIQKLKNLLPSS